jgi:Reverse transcriptase (RNA-dependent DNA polymerase)
MLLLQHFYTHSLNVSKLNHAMLCLIPKESNAQVIQKFRLISLIDFSYKIISKVLTNRLTGCVGRLVDPAQAAFIPGRYILDNVLAANKIIHFVKVHGQKGIVLKVDFEKAYDRVNWSFLLEMLRSRGFGQKWTLWIDNLLKGAQTCINFNGSLTSYFTCKRGLRQGDPLSPLMFDLVTDTLCQILTRGKNVGIIEGLGPMLETGFMITNFLYADDTVFF